MKGTMQIAINGVTQEVVIEPRVAEVISGPEVWMEHDALGEYAMTRGFCRHCFFGPLQKVRLIDDTVNYQCVDCSRLQR